jgi:hypothetical protein
MSRNVRNVRHVRNVGNAVGEHQDLFLGQSLRPLCLSSSVNSAVGEDMMSRQRS